MSKNEIEKLFPDLLKSSYSIISPATIEYNCIAWAAGNTYKWWWPDPYNLYYWPLEVPRSETVEAFIKAYEILGYTICYSEEYEDGFEKIALYVDSTGKPTHAARQLGSGKWTSKIGRLEDIEHNTLYGLAGTNYGSVAVILKRPKK